MNPVLRYLPGALAMFMLACSQATAPPTPTHALAAKPATPAVPASSAPIVAAAPVYDARVIHFGGYGPAAFTGNEESVRQAFGRPMSAATAPQVESCYYLFPEARQAKGSDIGFMFEGGKFVRYDVRDPGIVAPGGLVIGMSADAVLAAFPGRVETQPHKYVEGGKVMVVKSEIGGDARLVFELDAAGTITRWRIGIEPQVLYVEGCG